MDRTDKKFVCKTSRLIIRPLLVSDYEAWKTSTENVKKQKSKWDRLTPPSKLSKNEFRKLIKLYKQHWKDDIGYYFAIFEKDTGAYVGIFGYSHFDRKLRNSCNFSYYLLNTYWGKGYAYEAVIATLKLAFMNFNIHRLEALIEPENRRSINFAKRLGMRREGLCKSIIKVEGSWKDFVLFGLTSEECGFKWAEKKIGSK